jgi:hypothetical protein
MLFIRVLQITCSFFEMLELFLSIQNVDRISGTIHRQSVRRVQGTEQTVIFQLLPYNDISNSYECVLISNTLHVS